MKYTETTTLSDRDFAHKAPPPTGCLFSYPPAPKQPGGHNNHTTNHNRKNTNDQHQPHRNSLDHPQRPHPNRRRLLHHLPRRPRPHPSTTHRHRHRPKHQPPPRQPHRRTRRRRTHRRNDHPHQRRLRHHRQLARLPLQPTPALHRPKQPVQEIHPRPVRPLPHRRRHNTGPTRYRHRTSRQG